MTLPTPWFQAFSLQDWERILLREKAGLKLNIQKTKIQSHHFMANRWGNNGNSDRLYFLGFKNHCGEWLQPLNLKMLIPWKKSYGKPRQHIEKQRYHFANKGPYSQSYGFCSSHVWMWQVDHKEGWAPKNWYFWTIAVEKTLESPLDCKEIQPVPPQGNQYWLFIERTDVEAEISVLWPPDAKN